MEAGKIKMGRKMVEIDIETAERLIASGGWINMNHITHFTI